VSDRHPSAPAADGPALRAAGVSRSFAGVQALADVDLEVRPGTVVGLIGANGAGKTTLINVMTGFDRPTAGTVSVDGRDVTRWPAPRRARSAGIARTFQHGHLFAGLTVRENVEVSALGCGAGPRESRERAAALLAALGLADRADAPAAGLPHGDARKVGVARALATQPRYVLMDEPAAGLSEPEVPGLVEVIDRLRGDTGAGVLLVDHNVALILRVCDRIHVLDQGRTLAEGTPEEIRSNVDVTSAYLGGSGTREGARRA